MQTNGNLGKSLIYFEKLFSELIFDLAAFFLVLKIIYFNTFYSLLRFIDQYCTVPI